jgi:hypothetical protein
VRKLLGRGGTGAVYQALDRERNIDIALKTLLTLTPDGLLRFKEEFRALQDLNFQHPNLVGIGELFGEGREWFFTMELVDGVDFLRHARPHVKKQREISEDAQTVERPLENERIIGLQPPTNRFDEGRLRACLPQLVAGLETLHAAGKVHRDVKPSNILVTREGRVVLLDFGLVIDSERNKQLSQNHIVGTVAYMAPEQAAGDPVGPAADWYALGVVLYEALTGIVPFVGTTLDVLTNKQQIVPQSPRSMLPDVPRDLDALCCQLLRIDPRDRPETPRIYEALGMRYTRERSVSLSISTATGTSNFVGREPELHALHRAYEEVRAGETRVVYVAGESGVGKTALVRRFTDGLELTDPEALVRQGRCYEFESVPFKALDSLIDNISRGLMRLPRDEARALMPAYVALMAQVFPVLRRVEAVADAPVDREGAGRRAVDQRSRLFAAVRELFQKLGARQPLCLVINDLQWADADSLAMLSEILRPPQPPRLLLIATTRTATNEDPQLARLLREIPGQVLQLGRLQEEEARQLAALLVRRSASSTNIAPERIAEEAGGHPQYIDELVRYAHLHGVPATGSVQLEEALWYRVARIDLTARRLLEVVTLASGPLMQDTAAQAAEIGVGQFSQVAKVLRAASLVKTSGTRTTDTIEPYHDRVRSAVRAHLSDETARAIHRRIALSLEVTGKADPAGLAVHWFEAGDRDKAFQFGLQAADKAAEVLAFDRAAHFYALCLEHAPEGGDHNALRMRLAEALANAGRGAEAAVEFQRAGGETSERSEALELRRRAAEQYLRSGRIDEGLASIRSVLAEYGWELPKPGRALFSLLLRRARVRLRGLGFSERSEREIPRSELQRIDICWSVSAGLAVVDTVVGADFQARQLILALQAGEPYRIVRALAMEAAYVAADGVSTARTEELLERTRHLANEHDHPHGRGLVAWATGTSAFLQGRWRDGQRYNAEAESIFREQCTGVSWELDTARFVGLWCAFYCGDLQHLFERTPALLREAETRGDSYAVTNLRTAFTPFMMLAADDPGGALDEATSALDRWSRQGFHLQHYNSLFSRVTASLYRGDDETAERLVRETWPAMSRAKVFFIQQMKIRALHLRGCARLALASPLSPRQKHLLRLANDDARRLDREKKEWAKGLASLLRAGAARAAGDIERCERELRQAIDVLEGCDMKLFAAGARRQLGQLVGGGEGRTLTLAADRFMSERQIRNPERFTRVLVPGFPDS